MSTNVYCYGLLASTATDLVRAHRLNRIALRACRLTYMDALMDALSDGPGKTVRDVAGELYQLVPGVSEEDAVCLARTKYAGVGLDGAAAICTHTED